MHYLTAIKGRLLPFLGEVRGLRALFCCCTVTLVPVGGAALFTAECTEPAEAVVSVSNGIGFTTGGGFSNVTSRYAYQNDAVTAFLKTSPVLPPANDFNASGQVRPMHVLAIITFADGEDSILFTVIRS